MIVCQPHPDDPARTVFVPLVFDSQRQCWVPVMRDGQPLAFAAEADALQAVVAHVYDRWRDVHEQARLVRALCEHPDFDFTGDGIDSDMVIRQAHALTNHAERLAGVLPRLLDAPDANDPVELDSDGLLVIESGIDPAELLDN